MKSVVNPAPPTNRRPSQTCLWLYLPYSRPTHGHVPSGTISFTIQTELTSERPRTAANEIRTAPVPHMATGVTRYATGCGFRCEVVVVIKRHRFVTKAGLAICQTIHVCGQIPGSVLAYAGGVKSCGRLKKVLILSPESTRTHRHVPSVRYCSVVCTIRGVDFDETSSKAEVVTKRHRFV